MKNSLLKLSVSLFIAVYVCSSFAVANPSPATGDDSLTVFGKFIQPTAVPNYIKVSGYSVWDSGPMTGSVIPVSPDGTFSFRVSYHVAQQVGILINKTLANLMTDPNEKTYHVEISGENENMQKMRVMDSRENDAFNHLTELNKKLTDSLTDITRPHAIDASTFPMAKNILLNYQANVSAIMHEYPETYTAKVICTSELMPESSLASIKSLRENYLKRQAFANPAFYNTNFLFSRIFANYFLILQKKDTMFSGFLKALDISSKNEETAKLFQQALFLNCYNMKREQTLQAYMAWAKHHPERMVNPIVKARLVSIENCMPGAPYSDITLNDPNGSPRKLSETVNGAKLTLLIFYSPTCSHCQETLPRFLPLWNRYKEKGFKIYAIGLDATDDEWNNFIQTKGTGEWVNVFNRGNTGAGAKYSLGGIPAFILIDDHGKILTRFAEFDGIKEDIQKYFGD